MQEKILKKISEISILLFISWNLPTKNKKIDFDSFAASFMVSAQLNFARNTF